MTYTDEAAVPEGLTKLTVYLTNKSYEALYFAAELTELSKTDTVNRALQVYATVTKACAGEQSVRLTSDWLGCDTWQDVIVMSTNRKPRWWWRWRR